MRTEFLEAMILSNFHFCDLTRSCQWAVCCVVVLTLL